MPVGVAVAAGCVALALAVEGQENLPFVLGVEGVLRSRGGRVVRSLSFKMSP